MVEKSDSKPRKSPKQIRSQITVDSILEAATYILSEYGWDKFNTNSVAERAGVNIASLYQYFPNKESIISELHRLHVEKMKTRSRELNSKELSELDLRSLLKLIIKTGIEEHRDEPELHRIFHHRIPETAILSDSDWNSSFERQLEDLIISKASSVMNRKFAAFFIRTGLHAIIHNAIEQHPDYLDEPAFIDELTDLFYKYLKGN